MRYPIKPITIKMNVPVHTDFVSFPVYLQTANLTNKEFRLATYLCTICDPDKTDNILNITYQQIADDFQCEVSTVYNQITKLINYGVLSKVKNLVYVFNNTLPIYVTEFNKIDTSNTNGKA
jgi:hypothetical protein